MTTQRTLFGEDDDIVDEAAPKIFMSEDDIPDWFHVGSTTPKLQLENVLRGNHPMGHTLGPEDKTCGDCRHLLVRERKNRYFKCEKSKMTGGPATDIRKKWRACRLFEEVNKNG